MPESENPAPLEDPTKASAEPSKKPAEEPFTDYLAGLSNLGEEEESPDWLKNLQKNLPSQDKAEPAKTPGQKPDSDWLSGLTQPLEEQSFEPEEGSGSQRKLADFSFDESTESAPTAPEPAPDWLAAFTEQDKAGSAAQPAERNAPEPAKKDQPDFSDLPDWLANLTEAGDNANPAQPSPAFIEDKPASKDEPDDWLSSLGGDFNAEESASAVEPLAAANLETPDWLDRMSPNAPVAPAPRENPPAAEQPDWMANLPGSTPAEPEPAGRQDIPEPSPAFPADDLSDWLSSLNAPSAPEAAPQEIPEISAVRPAEDMPDWLASLKSPGPSAVDAQTTPETAAESSPALPADDIPDWLASMRSTAAPKADTQDMPAVRTDLPTEDMPDWLTSLKSPTEALAGELETAKAPIVPPADDLPDWLASLQASTPEIPTPPVVDEEHLPLAAASETDLGQAASQAAQPGPGDTEATFEPAAAEQADEMPDWLAEISGSFKLEKESAQETVAPFASSEVPSVPAEQPGQSAQTEVEPGEPAQPEVEAFIPSSSADQNIDSILSMDTPEWLSSFTLPKEQRSAPAQAEENTPPVGELPTEELPSWVQALRPMESVLEGTGGDEDEQGIEEKGPLAGLMRVLPGQPAPQGSPPSKTYSSKLLISETQQAQAALLANILNSENSPRLLSKQSKAGSGRVLRWIIAAVLLLVIIALAAYGSRLFPAPVAPESSGPVGQFIKTVTGLPDGAAVLVVMDYQPGFAGEMEAATGPVIEQLMSKNARLAFVSTSPMGGLMAERLLQKFAGQFTYQAGQQYINLGYLPGGAGGIRVFADQPAATLGQDALAGNLWNTPVLKGVTVNSVTSLANFAAVIVATDNPDTGRLWIEQAQPELNSKPMLMVVSAQAEPMIRPYFNSNQVGGLVSGLEGGMLYEVGRGKPGQAAVYWDSFGAGILISELTILIGGVWSLVAGLRTRRGKADQDES